MGTLLDIIVSLVIGGSLLLIAFTATDTATQEFFNLNSDAIVQSQLTRVSDIMEFDLRKMGFGIPESQLNDILQTTTPTHLKFIAQLNHDADSYVKIPGVNTFDSVPDTVEYKITPYETISFTDTSITLYNINRKVIISGITTSNMGIGKIGNRNVFRYLDQTGKPTGVKSSIKMVEVTLSAFNPRVVLSPELVMSKVGTNRDVEFRKRELRRILRASYWRQIRLVSKNLKR